MIKKPTKKGKCYKNRDNILNYDNANIAQMMKFNLQR